MDKCVGLCFGMLEALNEMAMECIGITLCRVGAFWTPRDRPRGTSDARTLIQQGVPSAGGVHCAVIVRCDADSPYNVGEEERLEAS